MAASGALGDRPTLRPSARGLGGLVGPARAARTGCGPTAPGLMNMFSRTLRPCATDSADAVGGDEAEAGGDGRGRRGDVDAAAVQRDAAAVAGSMPDQRAADALLPGAAQADERQDLAGMQRRSSPGRHRRCRRLRR